MNINSVNISSCYKTNKKSFSWSKFNIFLSIICLILGITYLISINDLAVKGFVLKELKNKQQTLMEANQDLQAQVLELQSYAYISSRLQRLNMVAVDDVIYLSPKGSIVAKK